MKISIKDADDNLQVKTLKPEYPPEAKAKGIEGTVRVEVVINERGNVTDVRAVSGNPVLIPPAVALVKRFPYRPFTRNGKRVTVTTYVDVPFELHPVDTYKDWNAHRDAAQQLRKDDHMDEAVAESQKALADARKLGDLEVADTYGDLADAYSREGRYEEAGEALLERLQTLKRSRVQDETEIAETESDLAGVEIWKGETEKAKDLLLRAIPVQEKYLRQATLESTKGVYSAKLSVSLGMLARVRDLEGQLAEAETLYKRSLVLGEKTLPLTSRPGL